MMSLFSCIKEDPKIDNPGNQDVPKGYSLQTFTATSEDAKTTIDGGVTKWSTGDQIKVILDDNTALTADLTGGANTATGTFQATVPDGKTALYAVYPASAYSSVSGTTVNVVVAAEQPGTFAAGNIAVAKVAADHSMSFKNMNSFLVFQLKTGSEVTKVEVASVDGSSLVGTIPVDCSGSIPAAGAAASPASTVSMATSGAGTYYLSVLSGATHAKGLKLRYFKGDDETGVYYLNRNMTVELNQMYALGEVETARNYYVTVDGAGKMNGMDWANALDVTRMWAKLNLEGTDAEIDAVKLASIDGATFHLGAGTYNFGDTPLLSFNETNPVVLTFKGGYPAAGGAQDLSLYRADFTGADSHAALRVHGKMAVHFEGIGFVNGSVSGDEKGAIDLNGDPNEGWSVSATMSYCYIGGNTNTSYAAAPSDNHNQGAGLRLKNLTSFTADHVTIEGNTSYAAAGAFIRNTTAFFTDCIFKNNVAYNKAGAIYTTGDNNATTFVDFVNCVFEDNESKTYQGAALLQNKGTNSFTNCTFTNNDSVDSGASGEDVGYGGAINVVSGNLTIGGCTFSGNDGIWGGAIMYGASNTLSITGTTFSGNKATKDGGALELGKGSVELTNCIFTDNEALHDDINKTSGEGYGGAIDCYGATNLTVEGGSFSGNVAWRGGAMNINTSGSASVTGVTFTGNGSLDDTRAGGAIYGKQNFTITDCTFGGANAADGNKAKFGGAINHVKNDDNHGVVTLNGGVFRNNVANECGGAICEESGMNIDRYNGVGTLFQNNSVTAETAVGCGGGALWAETYSTSSNKNVKVKYAVFKGNEAFSGGACLVYGNSSGLYFADCTFGGENAADGNYARGNSGNGGGGSLYMDKKSYSTFTRCTITGDHARRYGGSVFANTNGGNYIAEGCTFTGCYSSNGWGGAINTYNGKMDQVTIKGCSFINCHSNCGGAILTRMSSGKLAITDFNGEGCLFQGNYADHATYVYCGGALQIEGASTVTSGTSSLRVTIWKARFVGNYSGNGGAIYAKSGGNPDVYIDRCSFDGNYITKEWGAVMASDGMNRLHINNTTIRNSYTTSTDAGRQTGNKPSWIAIYGDPAAFSISNSTIIGDPQYSSDGSSFTPLPSGNGLINYGGSTTLSLINNIIVANTPSIPVVYGDTGEQMLDLRYNQYGTATNVAITDSGGNVSGLTAASFDGLSWTDNCWKWNGTIGGNAPSLTDATDVLDRLNAINAAYVSWIASPDDHFDYYGENRGDGDWWPGAYQAH